MLVLKYILCIMLHKLLIIQIDRFLYTPVFICKQVPSSLDFLGWQLILSGPRVDCTKGYRGLRRDLVYISHGQSSCLNKSIHNKNTNVAVVQMTSHPSREYWRP